MPANVENSAVATGLAKVSFHSNSKERQCQGMLKLLQITLISHAGKVMLKILQARLQQYVNCELPDVQAGFRKGRGTRDQVGNILWIMKTTVKVGPTSPCLTGTVISHGFVSSPANSKRVRKADILLPLTPKCKGRT